MNWWIVVAAVLAVGWMVTARAWLVGKVRARSHDAVLRLRIAALQREVMKVEARSRGVGGTGEHATTTVAPLFPPLAP